MTSASVSVNTQTPTLLSSDLPTATTIFNNGTSTVWVGGTPAVSPNIGTPIAPNGVIQISHGGPVYAILDSSAGVTATATVTYAVGVTVQAIPVVSPQSDSWGSTLIAPANGTYTLAHDGSSYSWGSCTVRCVVEQTAPNTTNAVVDIAFNLYVPLIDTTLALGSLAITPAVLYQEYLFTSTVEGWTTASGGIAVAWDGTQHYEGPGSLRIGPVGVSSAWTVQSPWINSYSSTVAAYFTAWVLPDANSSGCSFTLGAKDSSGVIFGSTTVTLGPAGIWQKLSFTATGPYSGATTWRLIAQSQSPYMPAGSYVYLDYITVYEYAPIPSSQGVTSTVTIPKTPYVIQATKSSGDTAGQWQLSTSILPSS